MICRFLLLFLLNQNPSYTLKTKFVLPVFLREYQEINPVAMDSYLFWLCFRVYFWARGREEPMERRKHSLPREQPTAHVTKVARGSFLCNFAGHLLLAPLNVVFLTALLPPSPAWPCWSNSQQVPEHSFNQARLDRPRKVEPSVLGN